MYLPPPSPATDAMFATRPQRRSSIPGRKACVHRNVPVAFTASSRFQSSRVSLWRGAEWAAPALLTRMSTCPSSVSAACASARTSAGFVTSPATARACRPAARSSVASASTWSRVRAMATTAAPAPASARVTAIPMPRPAPVTTAPRPASVTGPAPPGPLGDVGKEDARAVVAPLLADGGLDGGDVRRVEVRVRDHDDPEGVLPQAARDVDEQRSHGSGPERHRAGESGGELGGGVGEGREQQGVVATRGEPRRRGAGHRLRDHHVGGEGQMRTVRLDGADGQDRHRLRPVEVADLLPGQVREVEDRHESLYGRGQGG